MLARATIEPGCSARATCQNRSARLPGSPGSALPAGLTLAAIASRLWQLNGRLPSGMRLRRGLQKMLQWQSGRTLIILRVLILLLNDLRFETLCLAKLLRKTL